MASFLHDNDDLRWYLERGIEWEPIYRLTELDGHAPDAFATVEEAVAFYKEVAAMVGELAAEDVAPIAAAVDRDGVRFADGEATFSPKLQALFDKIRSLDLHGLCLPRDLGGMNAPLLVYLINSEMLARADVSIMAHHGFHGGMALAMLMFSIMEGSTTFDRETGRIVETRFRDYIGEILRGDAWGCMDITEPDAGSDMAALRTVGEQDADGNWFVTGQKIFITSGHGKYHFVIARTEKAAASDDPMAGLSGLSFFLVPTYEELPDGTRRVIATLDRIEDKLGHHGSVTAARTFDRAPAQLVGKRGEGFKYMLMLMNNARLGVGFESIGLCEAAYRLARGYAAERPSMGKTIDRHPMIADFLDEMRTDIQGLRALAMYGAVEEEQGQKLRLMLEMAPDLVPDAEARRKDVKRHQARARRVTPLLKYLAAEKAVEMARRCVQIHGGNGYMREYGAEKLLRDAVVMPIYEGTSQIQSLMAMKDTLGGILKNPQGFVRRLADARIKALSARDPLDRRLARIQQLSLSAQQRLVGKTVVDKVRSLRGRPITEWPHAVTRGWNPKRDFEYAMLHAEHLTRLMADEAIVEILVEQAHRFPERREVAERYLERAEPRCKHLHELIHSTGNRLLQELARREDTGVTSASDSASEKSSDRGPANEPARATG